MVELPSGTVTFLFTDIEGSTRLWEKYPKAMTAALGRHDELLRECIESHGGHVVKMRGDGVHAAFATADAAVVAAVALQHALAEQDWEVTDPLLVRVGVHTGAATLRAGDYFGSAVNRAARLMDLAHGGQIVCSQSTADLTRDGLPDGVALIDLGEHRLRDLTRAERVFQVDAATLRGDFAPLASLDAFPGNLPFQMTSFVGRQHDIDQTIGALRESRVVTLTGVGGVGKTRLALQVAAEAVPKFPDGAWLVELAEVRDAEMVPDAVVTTFGLQPRASSSPRDTVLEFLRSKEILLILDNCEHVLRPVGGLVAEIVHACRDVHVLATSREGLNVGGERILAVSSLEVPDGTSELDTLVACDAVTLFVDRAQAVKANFALDPANAATVAQICRRLDGIPLAIELAAARIAMLTPTELSRRLDQRFRLLAGTRHGSVERHQTLRAAIDWSYEMLTSAEQELLARLSIFAGGFALEASEVVTAGGAVEADVVFDLLASLVARSLVVADTENLETRYRLLETIRQYALERLDENGATNQMRAAHSAYYTEFIERAVPLTWGPDGTDWEERLERESENIRAALAWAIDTQDADRAVRLLAAWSPIAQQIEYYPALSAAAKWAADPVLAIPGADVHPGYPAVLVVAAYGASTARGNHELARRRSNEALNAAQRLGTDVRVAVAIVQSWNALGEGSAPDAVDYATQAIACAGSEAEPRVRFAALASSALALTLVGDIEGAVRDAHEVLRLAQLLPNSRVASGLRILAAFALSVAEPERALVLTREVVANLPPGQAFGSWPVAGEIAANNGQLHEALEYFDRGLDALYWSGQRTGLGPVLGRLATLVADGDPEAAAVLLGVSDALAPRFSHSRDHLAAREHVDGVLEAALGHDSRAELYANGSIMSDADAVRYAHQAIGHALMDERVHEDLRARTDQIH
jgi:predicted ATPase/class 3 adenylate cyclase